MSPNTGTHLPLQGITEQDIADYLLNTPGFFERHAEVLHNVQLTSPHSHRAVSLQQRQMEMLRERIKGLEHRIVDMIRHGQENVLIADRLHRWTLGVLSHAEAQTLPALLLDSLRHDFLVPQAHLKLWDLQPAFSASGHDWSLGVSPDVRSLATSLTQPYCGPNVGFEAASWLDPQDGPVLSMAMVPLRRSPEDPRCFGLLVLGSPDATRFSADMGVDFLVRIGAIASAGLSRLVQAETPAAD